MVDEIKIHIGTLKRDRRTLRNFGLLMGAICSLFSLSGYFRGNHWWLFTLAVAVSASATALTAPLALDRVYRWWMSAAFVIGWIMTRVILTAAFLFVFIPYGFFLRVIGKDLLRLAIEKESYWANHSPVDDRSRYKKQY